MLDGCFSAAVDPPEVFSAVFKGRRSRSMFCAQWGAAHGFSVAGGFAPHQRAWAPFPVTFQVVANPSCTPSSAGVKFPNMEYWLEVPQAGDHQISNVGFAAATNVAFLALFSIPWRIQFFPFLFNFARFCWQWHFSFLSLLLLLA
jgi:hypothetical protein